MHSTCDLLPAASLAVMQTLTPLLATFLGTRQLTDRAFG
jgi:hypothetical protein